MLYEVITMSLEIPFGIVANRVRLNTRSFANLKEILSHIEIPLIAYLRDTQQYVNAAEEGSAIVELKDPAVKKELLQWTALVYWLETGRIPPHMESRITSYNVCYTKLLRKGGDIKAGDVIVLRYLGPKGGPGMQYAQASRITSYNVCYTKLLRAISEK